MPTTHAFGWKRPRWGSAIGEPLYHPPRRLLRALPPLMDLRPNMPAVFDQGSLGSCTANACAGAIWYDEHVEQVPGEVTPSRLFQYYNSRLLEGTTGQDAGATIADSVKAVVQYGYVSEAVYPYDLSKFAQQPPQSVYQAAATDLITDYAAVQQTADGVKGAIAAGHPVLFGFDVPNEYEAIAGDGFMRMPPAGFSPLGGHANLLCGFNDNLTANGVTGYFVSRNSWGAGWGQAGYCYLPYAFVLDPNVASDFWVINTVPAPTPGPGPGPGPSPGPNAPIVGAFHLARRSPAGQAIVWSHPRVTLAPGNYDVSGPV